ncbi:winged helix-turn-helix transcriptional regulator [Larkinella soli]|uniref:winged helix-turn-helix transcriptional regulator n=1 Tax=Larkinella soli TaxID=1770527 RepID=UPI001E5797D6|nr:helix-turn-helix domain-containing protein [Larkinella soli]
MISNCPLTSSLILIHGRWKLIILWQINGGIIRFGELRRAIPLVTEKMLTDQLRELERDGFVERVVYPEVPPRVEYSLTSLAQSLIPILEQLLTWGEQNQAVERVKQHFSKSGSESAPSH